MAPLRQTDFNIQAGLRSLTETKIGCGRRDLL